MPETPTDPTTPTDGAGPISFAQEIERWLASAAHNKTDGDAAEGRDADASGGSARSILCLRVSGLWLGIETRYVTQVVGQPAIHAVPLTPPRILGVASVQGQVVPVLDMRRVLGLTDGSAGPTPTGGAAYDGEDSSHAAAPLPSAPPTGGGAPAQRGLLDEGDRIGERRMVVLAHDEMTAGIPVEKAREVIEVPQAVLRTPTMARGTLKTYAESEWEVAGTVLTLLNVPKLFADARVTA